MSKAKKLSVLVESQLPDFIASEYDNFSKFLQKYYEQLESPGQPLDIISNIQTYRDVDYYEKNLLKENTVLSSSITPSNTTINVQSTAGFPEKNGYIAIGDEIVFYKSSTSTSFVDCYRNVSGTTKLGDLYHLNDFKTVSPSETGTGTSHSVGEIVNNISNLFLYAFVKNFEKEYLDAFPEQTLKKEVDKRVLIKNIKQFYRAKGTDQSIKFIFNSIVAQEPSDIPSVYYPKDDTFKASGGEWIDKYGLQVKVISGDVTKLVGQKIIQDVSVYNKDITYSFAVVDAVVPIGDKNGESLYEIVLAEDTVVGKFVLSTKSYLTKILPSTATTGNFVNVYSTSGWEGDEGEIRVGNETITYRNKNINQFKILNRTGSSSYSVGTPVYSNSTLCGYYPDNNDVMQEVKLLALGYLYDLTVSNGAPGSSEGDKIQVSDSGFTSLDPIVYDSTSNSTRWKINENNTAPTVTSQPTVTTALSEVIADVSAVYEDAQYVYIASSGFPSHAIGPFTSLTSPQNQNLLKLIKKTPTTSTEITKTPTRDIGILVNGVRLYSYKDPEDVISGGIDSITVTDQGTSYKAPPFVLFSSGNAKAIAVMSGEVVESIEITDSGTGYTSDPTITITSGRNAVVTATVTGDRVTRLNIIDPGEYYSSPPTVIISDSKGRGRYAEYTANVSAEGKIVGFNMIQEGKFYTQENISVEIVAQGRGATAIASVKRWKKNRFKKIQSSMDTNYGFYFDNINPALGYGYGQVANPKSLRVLLNDNLDINGLVPTPLTHSPILGYAYDGNPIYGPYGYVDPLNAANGVDRMTSSYVLKTSRLNGPSDALGTYIEDYEYKHRTGTLDENNGRYCITPEYPNGVYAYFITIDSSNNPVFPYVLGEKFYSIPVISNYENFTSQKDLPKSVTRYRTDKTPKNGIDTFAIINSVNSGSVTSISLDSSSANFSVNNKVYFDEKGTNGSDLASTVKSLKGKPVLTIQSKQVKIRKIDTVKECYAYANDTISQLNTGATGEVVGDCFNAKELVVRVTSGTFNDVDKLYTNRNIFNLTLDKESSYQENSNLSFTTGSQTVIQNITSNVLSVSSNPFKNGDPIAFTTSVNEIDASLIYYVIDATINSFKISISPSGTPVNITNTPIPGVVAYSEKGKCKVIKTTLKQNSVIVELIRGSIETSTSYYLNSDLLEDTVGSKIVGKSLISSDIEIAKLNTNVALVNTVGNHNLSKNDEVEIAVVPNPSNTTTEYNVRRRIHQKVNIGIPVFSSKIIDTGIGNAKILNGGSDYAYNTSGSATFTNVELVFYNQTLCRDVFGEIVGSSDSDSVLGAPGNSYNAKATVIVSGGIITSITITSKGKGYKRGDLLTVSNASLNRNPLSASTQVLKYEVVHVGFGVGQTTLQLETVNNLSVNDYLQIDEEIVKISSVNTILNTVVVDREQRETIQKPHYDGTGVTLYDAVYRFTNTFSVGNTASDPFLFSYNSTLQELEMVFNTSQTVDTITSLVQGVSFFDESTPAKIVTVKKVVYEPTYKFEFAKSPENVWTTNPIIEVQKYYQYKFNTTHPTLAGSYLEFSPTKSKNILTVESNRSSALPGSVGSFIEVTFGFGPFYSDGDFIVNEELSVDRNFIVGSGLSEKKKDVKYTYYYYYDKSGIIQSDDGYLKIINDPLQGVQKVTYTTPTAFLYEMASVPAYDGSGLMSYTTTSTTAIGEINNLNIQNPGKDYIDLPKVSAVDVSSSLECLIDAVWNPITQTIDSVIFKSRGLQYSKPKVIVVDGDGVDAAFNITKNIDNSIKSIIVTNKGKRYTYKPTLKVVETDIVAYCYSNTIGVPKTAKIVYNGFTFDNDKTTRRQFTSSYFLVIKDFSEVAFLEGEEIVQYNGSNLLAKATVSKNGWKEKSNILKVENVVGKFKEDLVIIGKTQGRTATVIGVYATFFNADIRPYYDNLGYYASDKSKLGSVNQKLADSFFYQEYSYVIKSRTPVDIWRNLIRQTIHPAGFKVFGELSIEGSATTAAPVSQPRSSTISVLNLWDPVKNKITVENTYRTLTQSTINVSNINQLRGKGSVLASSYDTGETLSYEFYVDPKFNGYFDESGNRAGTKTFAMKLKGSGNALTLDNIQNFIVTLDGVVQEPSKSFYLGASVGTNASSAAQITFAQPPLGYRNIFGDPITQAQYVDGSDSPPQKFIGRAIKFKDQSLNNQYFRKIKDISSQFNNTTKTFALYYEDNTPVELSTGDNLLVSIDGVIQQAGSTPLLPVDRAYYIRRTVVPNEIVFVEAPRKFENNIQSFFAYSISSYERLTVEDRYINGTTSGPFILRSALTGKTISVDDDRNVLVFLDGVLQERLRTYTINGANITFKEAIRVGQKINILYVYGREFKKNLKAFNFEQVGFFNRFEITLTGQPLINDYRILESDGAVFTQSNGATGTVKSWRFDGTNTRFVIDSRNKVFTTTDSIDVFLIDPLNGARTYLTNVPSSSIVLIDSFEENDEKQDYLRRSKPGWLVGSRESTSGLNSYQNFIEVGDLIKIDGESATRKVLDVPDIVVKTSYRDQDDLNSSYFGNIGITNYNGVSLGEGLDVVANISGGKVVSLTWNKKDYPFFETKGLRPIPNAYGYESAPQLMFVAQPQKNEGGEIIAEAQGGGARAIVIVENGEVIDLVLLDGGSGYLTPPRVYITRGYELIKQSKQIDTVRVITGFSPQIDSGKTLYVTTGDSLSTPGGPPIQSITSIVTFTPNDTSRDITAIIQKQVPVVIPQQESSDLIVCQIQSVGCQITSTNVIANIFYSTIETPAADIVISSERRNTVQSVAPIIESGIRTLLKLKAAPVYRSLYETGAYLDIEMDLDDNIVYIPDTSKFTPRGKLMIEDEIVYYDNKLSDRFYNVIRGRDNTTIKTHAAGVFLRQYNEDVTIVFAGLPAGGLPANIQSIVVTGATINVAPEITTISQIETLSDVKEVNKEITCLIQPEVAAPIISVITLRAKAITESKVTTVSSFVTDVSATISSTLQILTSSINVSVTSEIDRFDNAGFVDFYVENVLFTDPILTRTGFVTLDTPKNVVIQRSGNIILVNNAYEDFSSSLGFTYTQSNLGAKLIDFNSWYNLDDGVSDVSAMTLDQWDICYPGLIIEDFTKNSQYASSRLVWNLVAPSIQNPVTISLSTGNIGSTLSVKSTVNFPSSGYLYHSNGTVYGIIQYTGKTTTTFTGCSIYNGSSTISNTSEIIPYSI